MILRLFIVPPRDEIGRDEARKESDVCLYPRFVPSGRPPLRPERRRRRERRGRDLNLNRAGRGDRRASKRTTTKAENHRYSLPLASPHPTRFHPWNPRRLSPGSPPNPTAGGRTARRCIRVHVQIKLCKSSAD